MAVMLRDVLYAVRTLRRSPGFAASAILALALGVGANTAVFSVVYAVLLKPLPYPDPDRLVRLSERNAAGVDSGVVSIGTFVDWRSRSRTLDAVAVYTEPASGGTLWGAGDRFDVVKSSAVSPALFPMLRVSPILGRTFRPEGEQDKPSGDRGKAVISYGLWQRYFGGAPDIVGRSVTVEGRFPLEVVGVMPRGFAFPEQTDAWVNLAFVSEPPAARRRAQSFHTIARLRPGATIDRARVELRGISAQLAAEQPASNAGWTAEVAAQAGSDTAAAKPALLALLGAVAGVLLIGCASVANLLLARASARRHELAVRLALGAGTLRLVRQCLTEAVVLSAVGAVAGLALGEWLARVLVHLAPPDIPRLGDVGMNGALVLFAAGTALVSAAFIGLAPALQARRASHEGGLRPDARAATSRGGSVRRLLIAGEVAVVVLLLTGALLLVRTFVKLRGVDLGFQPQHVLNVSTRWPIGKLFPSAPGVKPWPRVQRAVDGLLASVGTVPGVEAVGLISDVPLTGDPFSGSVWRADAAGASGLTPPSDPHDRWRADLSMVTPGYFPALGVPIVRGRNFLDSDRLSDDQLNNPKLPRPGVVIVNSAFASRYFPGEDAVGRTLIVYDDQEFGWSRTIIGVAADVRGRAVAETPAPALFIPHAQHPDVFIPSLIVRTALPFDAVAAAIRQRIAAYDPQLLVQRIQPMDDVVSGALSRPRFNLVLLGSFAFVALALSAVGIYGVLAYLVAQRTREIGIRMALGARAADVLRLVLGEGMMPVMVGAAAGIVAAVLATRSLRSMLFGVTPLDPVSFAAAPALLGAVALLACYVPARRATRVDPLVALRED
jgi:putative ABC transport system permease protein